jgi:hypothetical protein
MDIENIFNLFHNLSPEEGEENTLSDIDNNDEEKDILEQHKVQLKKYFKTPSAKIAMFNKTVINYHVFHESINQYLKNSQSKISSESIRLLSQSLVFERAWHYIKDISLDKKNHIKIIHNFNPVVFNKCLDLVIEYFEDIEKYERCHHLFEIKKYFNSLQK